MSALRHDRAPPAHRRRTRSRRRAVRPARRGSDAVMRVLRAVSRRLRRRRRRDAPHCGLRNETPAARARRRRHRRHGGGAACWDRVPARARDRRRTRPGRSHERERDLGELSRRAGRERGVRKSVGALRAARAAALSRSCCGGDRCGRAVAAAVARPRGLRARPAHRGRRLARVQWSDLSSSLPVRSAVSRPAHSRPHGAVYGVLARGARRIRRGAPGRARAVSGGAAAPVRRPGASAARRVRVKT